MKLLPSANSDKAWVYTVNADFADEEAKVEQLAIRFKNPESKQQTAWVRVRAWPIMLFAHYSFRLKCFMHRAYYSHGATHYSQ